jgi:hypothetical protein
MRQAITVFMLSTMLLPAAAQTAFPTEFPPGATELSTEELTKLLDGRVYRLKPLKGPEIRIEYRGGWAYVNIGNTTDGGRWRLENSAICFEWKTLQPGCSEVRLVGNVLYTKRPTSGEVLPVVPD